MREIFAMLLGSQTRDPERSIGSLPLSQACRLPDPRVIFSGGSFVVFAYPVRSKILVNGAGLSCVSIYGQASAGFTR